MLFHLASKGSRQLYNLPRATLDGAIPQLLLNFFDLYTAIATHLSSLLQREVQVEHFVCSMPRFLSLPFGEKQRFLFSETKCARHRT